MTDTGAPVGPGSQGSAPEPASPSQPAGADPSRFRIDVDAIFTRWTGQRLATSHFDAFCGGYAQGMYDQLCRELSPDEALLELIRSTEPPADHAYTRGARWGYDRCRADILESIASAMSAGTAETHSGSGRQPASAVPEADANTEADHD